MPYDVTMAQQYPAKMSAGAEHADSRPCFQVARCFQDAQGNYQSTNTVLRERQVSDFVDAKRREQVDPPPRRSDSVYVPISRTAEIRVFEVLPASFEEPIAGTLHHVSIDFDLKDRRTSFPVNFAVSVSKMAVVYYTALSYVVSY